MRNILLAMLFIIGASQQLYARTTYVHIHGTISDMTEQVHKIEEARLRNHSKVVIQIDSNGGRVDEGLRVIEQIRLTQKYGMKVVCSVVDKAVSMAFVILSTCDERYVTDKSLLMFHEAAYMVFFGRVTTTDAKILVRTQKIIDDIVLDNLDIDEKQYRRIMQRELWWTFDSMYLLDPDFLTGIYDERTGKVLCYREECVDED